MLWGGGDKRGGGGGGGEQQGRVSAPERTFLVAGARHSARIDGRSPFDLRALSFSFPSANGHCQVLLGQTRVYAVVSGEVVQPYPDRPTEGFFLFNLELSPMASPAFEAGRPSEYAAELGKVLERGLRESRAIDAESLCIRAAEKVWAIRCDVHVLDDGGNLLDAANLAAIGALLHFRRPEVAVTGEGVRIFALDEREPVALSIHHIPVTITFAFFSEGDQVLVDPMLKEEQVAEGTMSVTLNVHREVCAIQKAGGAAVSPATISRCCKIAAVKAAEITSLLRDALQQAAHQHQHPPPPPSASSTAATVETQTLGP